MLLSRAEDAARLHVTFKNLYFFFKNLYFFFKDLSWVFALSTICDS